MNSLETSPTTRLRYICDSESEDFKDIGVSTSSIHGTLTPIEKFMFGIKSPETRRQYPKLLLKFFDFLNLRGTLEQKAPQFQNVANRNLDFIENELTKFVILHYERIYRKEIAAGT